MSLKLGDARFLSGAISCSLALSGLFGATIAGQAQNTPPAAAQNGVKRTVIGDVKISGYNRITLKSDLSGGKIVGTKTTIEVPDKNSKSLLVVHADEVTIENANNPGTGRLEMSGRLTYTLTQQTPAGERILKGTAGKGTFRRETKRIELSNGVQATLADPRLKGPGTLRSGSITIDISVEPYKYTLEGSSDVNDIRFTPLPPKPKEKASAPNPDSQVGSVHIHHFATGEFQVGKTARFDGSQTAIDLNSQSGKSQGTFLARHIEAAFAPTGELTHTEATGTVHYQIERSIVRNGADGQAKQGRQAVVGTCSEATYDTQGAKITLNGSIDAALTDTLTLLEPAKLMASRLVVTDEKILRYELTGTPNHRRLQFMPRPAEPKATPGPDAAAKPAPPAFSLGTVTLTGFQTGIYEPGKRVELTAEDKQELILDTSEPKSQSSSHMQTHKFTAALAADGSITQAESGGPVTFHIQQLTPVRTEKATAPAQANAKPGKPKPRLLQALDGSAGQAVFVKKDTAQTITLQGPYTAHVTDPENLVEPGVATGAKGDSMSLDLLTRSFDFYNPSDTSTLTFHPRPRETDTNKEASGGK